MDQPIATVSGALPTVPFDSRTRLLRCLLTLSAAISPVSVSANRYLDNPDRVVDRLTDRRFAPIGEIESEDDEKGANGEVTGKRVGTAFLVSPCYVITNAHVAFGADIVPKYGKPYRLIFRAGTSPSASFAGRTPATPVLWGAPDSLRKNDWALLKLNACIGKRPEFGWLELAALADEQLISRKVAVVGFAADRDRGALSIGLGVVTGRDLQMRMLKFSASMASGQSGGPVFSVVDGFVRVVGMNTLDRDDETTFASYSDENANEFINIKTVLDNKRVAETLAQDVADWGMTNPAALPRLTSLSVKDR